MNEEVKLTTPKPFVFVLMPFDPSFDDIYKFGIKGAAEDANAYAERIDEQIFTDGILERVFNQINKADVIVADMTGRNPNVFYEVGYAHALGRIVLLLTQNVSDIPFDLQHHQHTVYGGSIETLRTELGPKIKWAVSESIKKNTKSRKFPFELSIDGIHIPVRSSSSEAPLAYTTVADSIVRPLTLVWRNSTSDLTPEVTHLYLFTREGSIFHFGYKDAITGKHRWLPSVKAHPSDATDGLTTQYRIQDDIPPIPPGASEVISLLTTASSIAADSNGDETVRLRVHLDNEVVDFQFKLAFQKKES